MVDVLGMLTARNTWNVCSMNEVRLLDAFQKVRSVETFYALISVPQVFQPQTFREVLGLELRS